MDKFQATSEILNPPGLSDLTKIERYSKDSFFPSAVMLTACNSAQVIEIMLGPTWMFINEAEVLTRQSAMASGLHHIGSNLQASKPRNPMPQMPTFNDIHRSPLTVWISFDCIITFGILKIYIYIHTPISIYLFIYLSIYLCI